MMSRCRLFSCCWKRVFHFGSVFSFFLEIFLHSSLVAYWAPTDLGIHLSVLFLFAFSYCSWNSQGKNTEMVSHSLLQWTTFCQNSPSWPTRLGLPCTAWLLFHWIRQGKNCRTIIRNKFSHCWESSRTHNRFPNLGIWQRDWEPQGNLTSEVSGIWL